MDCLPLFKDILSCRTVERLPFEAEIFKTLFSDYRGLFLKLCTDADNVMAISEAMHQCSTPFTVWKGAYNLYTFPLGTLIT